jgi:iron complex transport system ATP-binding protein
VGRIGQLRLAFGEALCVLGPNGSGKTTLFRTLLGLLPPLAGKVTLEGRDLRSYRPAEIARRVAYVPQAVANAFDYTLAEIVEMGRTAHLGPFQAPGAPDAEAARSALERLGIAHLAERPIAEVSGGEHQLALIARALAAQARTLVMDEPTASLDFGNQRRVLKEIDRLKRSGMAILFCTHDPDQAAEVADRVLLLARGEVMAEGRVEETLDAAMLARLYGLEMGDMPRRRFG